MPLQPHAQKEVEQELKQSCFDFTCGWQLAQGPLFNEVPNFNILNTFIEQCYPELYEYFTIQLWKSWR